jgi:hypothetical protein
MQVRFVRLGRGSLPALIPLVILALFFVALVVLVLLPVLAVVQITASALGAPNLFALLGRRLQARYVAANPFQKEQSKTSSRYSGEVIEAEVVDIPGDR